MRLFILIVTFLILALSFNNAEAGEIKLSHGASIKPSAIDGFIEISTRDSAPDIIYVNVDNIATIVLQRPDTSPSGSLIIYLTGGEIHKITIPKDVIAPKVILSAIESVRK